MINKWVKTTLRAVLVQSAILEDLLSYTMQYKYKVKDSSKRMLLNDSLTKIKYSWTLTWANHESGVALLKLRSRF